MGGRRCVMLGAILWLSALGSGDAGLVREEAPWVQILSPLEFDVLHTGAVEVVYRVSGSGGAAREAILLVNGTEALRTATTQPSVAMSGLPPGICNLSVIVVGQDDVELAEASTMFLISSAAANPRGAKSRDAPPPDDQDEGRWFALAVGSDDWGRGADSIPVFPSMDDLLRAKAEGWDPGSWGSATVETRGDVERLFDLIEGLNEGAPVHQQLVVSPYWVVGGPDYRGMAESGCPLAASCRYRERTWRHDDAETAGDAGPPGAWPFCRGDLRGLVQSHIETLVIYKLIPRKFTTHDDLYK